MMYVGHADGHAGDVYRMWNQTTNKYSETRDVIWLNRMFFEEKAVSYAEEPDDDEEFWVNPNHTSEERRDDDVSDDASDNSSVADGKTEDNGWVRYTTRAGRNTGLPSGLYDPSTGLAKSYHGAACENYYQSLQELDNDEIEYLGVGAGIGGGFEHTEELKPMKYKEAISSPDGQAWKVEILNEYKRMVDNDVFEVVSKKDLPPGTKIIDSTWACKKKSNGTLRARMVARGFRQIDGQHYDGSSIHAPVTNPGTIRTVLVLMLMAGMTAEVVDVKGAFLKGDIEKGQEIHMYVPEGWEDQFEGEVVLKLFKCVYGLKQAAMAFWKQLLECMKDMDKQRSTADPCLYFEWTKHGLVIIVSWIDDNLLIGKSEAVAIAKEQLMSRFDCEECGELNEYIGCKITRPDKYSLKFTQPVLLQSFEDEFDLPTRAAPTPARVGDVLTKSNEKDVLPPKSQTKYRCGVGKMMHVMQYSIPPIYNSVRDLARHMQQPGDKHMQAMLHCMKHCKDRPNRGLVLAPRRRWNGEMDFEFIISGKSDSDYAKQPEDRRSISGSIIYLEGAPVMFKSATQKHVALSVTEAELYAGVSTAQDMLYIKNVLESMKLKVQLPMVLEIDNQAAVHLANSWSVGGRARHIDVRQCFLRELKEAGILMVKWIPDSLNEADIFTKNLSGPMYENFARALIGKDEYTPDSE